MKSVRIIACLDVDGDQVVKSIDAEHQKDAGDPADLAKYYLTEGADEIMLLDIAGPDEGGPPIVELTARVRPQMATPLTVGGGIRSIDDIGAALRAGADRVSLNTAAINNPEMLREAVSCFGADRICVAVDARRKSVVEEKREGRLVDLPVSLAEGLSRGETLLGFEAVVPPEALPIGEESSYEAMATDEREPPSWEVYSHGGRVPTGLDIREWTKKVGECGAGMIFVGGIDGEGALGAFDLELVVAVRSAVAVPVVAALGPGRPEQALAAVTEGGASALLLASTRHDGLYRIEDLKAALS